MKELEDLIKKYIKEYRSYINELSFDNLDLKQFFLELLNEDDYQKRKIIWKNKILSSNKFSDELYKLSNPYYIGFGNPESKILFIGKEKGFDLQNNPELLFEESINNIYHWQHIVSEDLYNQPLKIQKSFDFSPLFPLAYNYKKPFNKGHTWYIYAKVLAKLLNNQREYSEYFNREDYFKSLFEKCFMTEFNFVPSKYSRGLQSDITKRIDFLKDDYFNNFNIVIIGARTYLDNNKFISNGDKLIEEIFKVTFKDQLLDGRLQTKKFVSNNKVVLLTSQLSGAAGWSNEALSLLAESTKEYH